MPIRRMADARVYRVCGIRLRSAIALPELTRLPGRRADCVVDVARGPVPAGRVDWFHRWRIGARSTWLRIGRRDGSYVLRFPDLADVEVSPSGRHIAAFAPRPLPMETLRHLVLDQVLPLALGCMGRAALHASAVHVPGLGTVAFAGGAGSGKSTLAAALARDGCSIVSDDCLVVAAGRDRVCAIPSYRGVRLWPDAASRLGYRGSQVAHYSSKVRVSPRDASRDRPSRLRAVFVLSPPSSRVRSVSFSPRTARDGFMGLLGYTYLLDPGDRAALTRLFHQLGVIADHVPIAGLRLTRDRRRLPELARDVRDLAGRLSRR
jgi:hypothetical protein